MPKHDSFALERLLAIITSISVVGVVLYLVIRNKPFSDPNLVLLLRIVLAVAMGIIGGTVPGFLRIDYTKGGITVRAAGALALVLVCFFGSPRVEALNL